MQEKIVCTGRYYNFKKGFEQCKNKCNLYNCEAIDLLANHDYSSVMFKNISEFRRCNKVKIKNK